MGNIYSQLFPPKPKFTDANVGDLTGKIYIVTGANTGVGKELARMLYSKNAKVYVATRTESRARAAMKEIQDSVTSKGQLVYLHLDLSDLTTIKATAQTFLSQESKLHVLFNNAGVMFTPQGSKSAQGYELQLGTNCLGHFLLVKLLTPVLQATARQEPANTVRVVWVSSSATELLTDRNCPIDMDNLDYHTDKSPQHKYGVSKAGNVLHSAEYARKHSDVDGIVSVALNPGNLRTELTRHTPAFQRFFINFILYPAVYGAYTELFAGLSPDVTVASLKKNDWVIPWGRFSSIRADVKAAMKLESKGGTGLAAKWWAWSEDQVKPYV